MTEVVVQVGANEFPAVARAVTGEESTRVWTLMTLIWKTYATYQARTKREILVVVLTPTS